jgi:nucleoside-diphosphate-sugar epimerase
MANMSFSTYGMLKAIGERITETLNGRTVHFWNVYGLETNRDKFHVISDFIDMGLRTKYIHMKTDGQELRDFLYVDDCSRALISVMENFKNIDKTSALHITSGSFTKIIDVAQIIGEKLDATVVPGLGVDLVQNSVLNQPDEYIRKFWSPRVGLIEGIQIVIDKMLAR